MNVEPTDRKPGDDLRTAVHKWQRDGALYAAAPDLLAACEALVKGDRPSAHALSLAQIAIKDARGETP